MKLVKLEHTFTEGHDGILVPEQTAGEFSFGDGSDDVPFSAAFWMRKNSAIAGRIRTILGKWNSAASSREWIVQMDDTGACDPDDTILVTLWDESTDAYIGVSAPCPLTSEMALIVVTYDGSGTTAGIKIYKAGVRIDDTTFSGGSYVAMEAFSDVTTELGRECGNGGYSFVGYLCLLMIWPDRELTADEVLELSTLLDAGIGFCTASLSRVDESDAQLAWSGTPGATVRIYRDGELHFGPYVDQEFDKVAVVPWGSGEPVSYEVREDYAE